MVMAITQINSGIHEPGRTFEQIFRRGDAGALAELYADDGMLIPVGRGFVRGKKAIREFWQATMDAGIKDIKLVSFETDFHGKTIIEVGFYALKGYSGNLVDQGKYIAVWKHEPMGWRLCRDIRNSSQPYGQD